MPDEKYQRLALGTPAFDYVSARLGAGRSLSRAIQRAVDLHKGVVYTHLPGPIGPLTINTFRSGGVASARISDEVVEAVIRRHLIGEWDVLIAESPVANCSDPWIREHPDGVLCYLDEVYHLGIREADGLTSIVGAIKGGRAASSGEVSAVTRWSGTVPTSGWPYQLSDLSPFVEGVKALVVGAFDGEGYIVWEPLPSG